MLNAKDFSQGVLGELRRLGWNRRGKTAWIRCDDATIVTDVQKSNYDQMVFVNIGIALHELGHADPPKYTDCHLQFRVERLIDGFPDGSTEDAEEIRAAVSLKEQELRALGKLEELRKRAAERELAGGLVKKEARKILGL